MRHHLGLVLLAFSCSRDPQPPMSAPSAVSPSELVGDCTRVLDDPAHTTVRMSRRGERSHELSDAVKAVRAKAGLSDVGGDSHDPSVTRTPSGRSPCDTLERAPVVVITKDELRVGNTHVANLAEVTANGDVIDALSRALPAAEDAGVAILLAEESTGTVVLNRVVSTFKRAGYSHLLLAVPGSASAGETRGIRF